MAKYISNNVLILYRVFIQDEKHCGITRTFATRVTTSNDNMEDVIHYVHMRSRNGGFYKMHGKAASVCYGRKD